MKYIRLFENFNKSDLESELYRYGIENYTINDDGTIDVDGVVNIGSRKLTKIPFKFGKVTGHFFCNFNNLKSLEGSPYEVGGSFLCYNNHLENLEGSPIEVGGGFDCSDNLLSSLDGMPLEIGREFSCYNNPYLKELISISNIEGQIVCDRNLDLSKFDGYCKKIIQA